MRCHTCKSFSSDKLLFVFGLNRPILEATSQPEVDKVESVLTTAVTEQKVGWLYITVYKTKSMQFLKQIQGLKPNIEHCFDRELVPAK